MMKYILLLLLVILTPALLCAQTTVNISVTDTPDNQTWNNGTYKSELIPPPPLNPNGPFSIISGGGSLAIQTGSLSGTGTASIVLPANINIAPFGTQWKVTVCPQATAACFSQLVIVGTSSPQTLAMTPPSIRINLQTTPPPITAYATGELTGTAIGSLAYILSVPGYETCQVISGNNCTTWALIGSGGGGTPGGTPFQVQINNSGVFGGSNCVNLPTFSSTSVNFDCDTHDKGPNPWIDVTRYGARTCTLNTAPCVTGITATTVASNATVTLSSASTFVNGDGVTLYGAGASQSMTTPGAPTVTPSIANVLTGTRMVSPGPAGATTYNYQIFAEDEHGGLTAVSTVGSTTTGAATLGTNTVNISSCTHSNNIVTCTTSSAHGYGVGTNPQIIFLGGTTDPTLSGWWTTTNVPDSTHFSFVAQDTRNGAPLSATGGTVTWFNCNHITWTRVTGAYRYWIAGRTGGSLTTIGYSWPENPFSTAISGSPITEGVNSWDDFGSTMMGNLILPTWIPSTPPVAATHDNLTTTISSGGGTTSITLASAPTVSFPSGTPILVDAVPAVLAAQAAALATGQGLRIYFPASPTSVNATYPINSFLDLTGSNAYLYINGTLSISDTVMVNRYSKIIGVGSANTASSFAFDSLPLIYVNAAYPAVHNINGAPFNMAYVSFQPQFGSSNNNLYVVQDFGGANPGSYYDDVEFITGGGNDYMGISLLIRGVPGVLSAQATLEETLTVPGPGVTQGVTATPSILCTDCAILYLKHVQASHRGIYLGMDAAGGGFQSDAMYFQGSLTPAITMASADGNVSPPAPSQSVFNGQSTMDSTGSPLLWFVPGSGPTQLYMDHAGATALGTNSITGIQPIIISGRSPFSTQVLGLNTDSVGPGQACTVDGLFASAGTPCLALPTFYSNMPIAVGPAYSLFMDQVPGPAPTLALTTGGSLTTTPHTYQIAPIWQNNGLGKPTFVSAPITPTTGNQSVIVTWTPVTGCKGYNLIRDGGIVAVSISSCATSTFTDTGLAGGGTLPGAPGGGPTMMLPGTGGMTTAALAVNGYQMILPVSPIATTGSLQFMTSGGVQNTYFDGFNRASLNISGPCFSGSCWTTGVGGTTTMTITSNQVTSSANALSESIFSGATFSPDQFAEVVFNPSAESGPGVRIANNLTQGYFCMETPTALNLVKYVANTRTVLQTVAITGQSGDRTRIDAVGNSLTCTRNDGVNVLTATDSSLVNGTPGLITGDNIVRLDDWSGGNYHPFNQLDVEQYWTQPQHATALALGPILPTTGGALPDGGLFSSLWGPSLSLCTDTTGKAVTTGCSGNISGLTNGQVAIAGSASTITSSKALQGTDANVLSAGTVSGVAATLCTDANGGATTAGCTGGSISGLTTGQVPIAGSASSLTSSKALQGTESNILTSSVIAAGTGNPLCTSSGSGATTVCPTLATLVYNTQSAATAANIAATNMVASTSALHSYQFSWTISLTAVGTSCTSSTTINMNAIFTDPNAGTTTTELLGQITIAAGGNGTVGFVAQGTDNILAKNATAVQYSTSGYTAGTGCTVNPTYQVSPTLVQLW